MSDRHAIRGAFPGKAPGWELNPLRAVKKVTLTDAIIREIISQIRAGALKPGDQLPAEHELTRRLNVSRPVLREALRSLATMNVIDIRPGQGAVVCDLNQSGMIHPDMLPLVLERGKELEQLHEARVVLEVAIAGLAAQRADEQDWARMEECLQLLKASKSEEETFFPARQFHLAVAQASHNPLLAQLMPSILDTLSEHLARRGKPLFSIEGEYEVHKELYDVLRRRDPEAAREAMLAHLEMSYRRWFAEDA